MSVASTQILSGDVDESMFTWWMAGQAKLSEILSGLPYEGVSVKIIDLRGYNSPH